MRIRSLIAALAVVASPALGALPVLDPIDTIAAPSASAAQLPTPPTDSSDWLGWTNWYRSLGDIPPLAYDPALDVGPRNHTRYLAAAAAAGKGACTHYEIAGRPWPAGEDHAHNILACGTSTLASAISLWMQTPYHGSPILDPSNGSAGAGITGSYQAMRFARGAAPDRVYTWPKDHGVIPSLTFAGNESPDPYAACPDAARPAGQPLFVFLPSARTFRSATLTASGQSLGVCALGVTAGQRVTKVMLFPKQALVSGTAYSISVSFDEGPVTWTATTTGPATGRVIAPAPPTVVATGSPSVMVPIGPTRIADSRIAQGVTRLEPYVPQRLVMRGRNGVPTDATGVVVNVTAVKPDGDGFITVYPCGGVVPGTSTVNYRQRQVLPTLTTVGLSVDGAMCMVSHARTDVVVDLFGAMVPGSGDGLHVIAPTRLIDTRTIRRRMRANETLELQVIGTAGVPSAARSFTANVTAVNPSGDGFLTVWPCGQPMPQTSNLNIEQGGVRPNLVTAAVGNGKWCISSMVDVDLVVDGLGWWGDAGQTFTSVRPVRLADTRIDDIELSRGAILVLPLAGRSDIPADVTSVALNVTATRARGDGYIQVFPCGTTTVASTVNVETDGTVSNASVVGVGNDGSVCVTVSATMHVVVDLTGYWR
ncbi:MAG: CAP domain-containing protein [Acidimicrobiia bacterium]